MVPDGPAQPLRRLADCVVQLVRAAWPAHLLLFRLVLSPLLSFYGRASQVAKPRPRANQQDWQDYIAKESTARPQSSGGMDGEAHDKLGT